MDDGLWDDCVGFMYEDDGILVVQAGHRQGKEKKNWGPRAEKRNGGGGDTFLRRPS